MLAREPDERDELCKAAHGSSEAALCTPMQRLRRKLVSETLNCVMATMVMVLTLVGCLLCVIYCPRYLPVITFLSCCLGASFYNIPLWISLMLSIYYFAVYELKHLAAAWASS